MDDYLEWLDLTFWTLVLASWTDEEVSALAAYAKWYEHERFPNVTGLS